MKESEGYAQSLGATPASLDGWCRSICPKGLPGGWTQPGRAPLTPTGGTGSYPGGPIPPWLCLRYHHGADLLGGLGGGMLVGPGMLVTGAILISGYVKLF